MKIIILVLCLSSVIYRLDFSVNEQSSHELYPLKNMHYLKWSNDF
jgi:hypothetical protein